MKRFTHSLASFEMRPDGGLTLMNYKDGFMGSVGNTPLIRLKGVSEETGCEIFGKAEFLNPSGSVKDRAAKAVLTN